jgi:hypothetical protein
MFLLLFHGIFCTHSVVAQHLDLLPLECMYCNWHWTVLSVANAHLGRRIVFFGIVDPESTLTQRN